MKVLVAIDTPSYNARRFSKPWIARVSLDDSRLNYSEWGTWIGSSSGSVGSDGRLELNADVGAVVAHGQRDGRGNKSENNLGIVQADGSLEPLDGKVAAVDYLRLQTEEEERESMMFRGTDLLDPRVSRELVENAVRALVLTHGESILTEEVGDR